MALTDDTKMTERIRNRFESIGVSFAKAGKKISCKSNEISWTSLEIGAKIGSALVSRKTRVVLPTIPAVILFHDTGKRL